jgi:hypothetical protein
MKGFLGIFRHLSNLFRTINQSEFAAGVLALIWGSGLDQIDSNDQQFREPQAKQKAHSNWTGQPR